MIVRILNEGQWHLTDDAVRGLNAFDDAVEQAVTAGDQDQLTKGCMRCWTGSGQRGPSCRMTRLRTPI